MGPSFHPDLQKHILSLFFPEQDHQNEGYTKLEAVSSSTSVRRRTSISQYRIGVFLMSSIHLTPLEINQESSEITLINVVVGKLMEFDDV